MFGQKNSELHTWVEERLSDFIDQQLAPAERARLENHLADCARCRASLESLRWTIALVKQAPAPALPRSFVLPVPARRAPSTFAFGFARFATALATLLLFAAVGIDLIMQFGGASAPAPAAMRESAATQSIALATTQPPESAQAQPAGAPLPPAPANVPPVAPTPSVVFRSPEVLPTPSVTDLLQKSQNATQPARQPSVGGAAPVTTAITATVTITPTQTATIVPPTSTPSPTLAPSPVPTSSPIASTAPVVSTLRVVQVALLFLTIFFGTLTLLLWWRK